MAVPAEIRAVPRPVNTIVDDSGKDSLKRYAVRQRSSSKYVPGGNPQPRNDELGGASVPFKFDIHAMIFSDDAPALEASLHRAFENKKVNMTNNRKEFFNVTLDEIKQIIFENYDKTVDFVDIPSAQQYRETLKIIEKKNNPQ